MWKLQEFLTSFRSPFRSLENYHAASLSKNSKNSATPVQDFCQPIQGRRTKIESIQLESCLKNNFEFRNLQLLDLSTYSVLVLQGIENTSKDRPIQREFTGAR